MELLVDDAAARRRPPRATPPPRSSATRSCRSRSIPEIDLDACIGSGACVRACPEDDVLAITDGRARLINPLSCIGHSACLAACPVGAITLVFGTATRGVELPKLDAELRDHASAASTSSASSAGMGLIRNAVEQGRQAAAAIARSAPRRRRLSTRSSSARALRASRAALGLDGARAAHARRRAERVRRHDRPLPAREGRDDRQLRAARLRHGAREDDVEGGPRRAVDATSARARSCRSRRACASSRSIADGNAWRVRRRRRLERRAANVVLALGRRGAPQPARRARRGAAQGRVPRCSSPRSTRASTCSSSAAATRRPTARIALVEQGRLRERRDELPPRRAGAVARRRARRRSTRWSAAARSRSFLRHRGRSRSTTRSRDVTRAVRAALELPDGRRDRADRRTAPVRAAAFDRHRAGREARRGVAKRYAVQRASTPRGNARHRSRCDGPREVWPDRRRAAA